MRQTIDDSLKELKLIDMLFNHYGYTKERTLSYLVGEVLQRIESLKILTNVRPEGEERKSVSDLLAKFLKEINDNDI